MRQRVGCQPGAIGAGNQRVVISALLQCVEPAALQDQVRLLLETYPVAAIKTGMLGSKQQVVAISEILDDCDLPLVVDPVMVASTGDSLQDAEAVAMYRSRLLPLATLITPNLEEARALLDPARSSPDDDGREAAEALARQFGCAALVTGGHRPQEGQAVDWLHEGDEATPLSSPWIEIDSAHGTGCTLSAGITALLATGKALREAVAGGREFLNRSLRESYSWSTPGGQELRALNQLPAEAYGAGSSKGLQSASE